MERSGQPTGRGEDRKPREPSAGPTAGRQLVRYSKLAWREGLNRFGGGSKAVGAGRKAWEEISGVPRRRPAPCIELRRGDRQELAAAPFGSVEPSQTGYPGRRGQGMEVKGKGEGRERALGSPRRLVWVHVDTFDAACQ